MRTFFCVPLSQPVRRVVAGAAEALRELVTLRASWVRPENYHLTLRFLGEIDPLVTVDLDRLARTLASDTPPFGVTIDRIGAFPSVDRARVLWVGGDAPLAYTTLADQLNRELRALGFEPESKATVAHVTVARLKDRADPSVGRAIAEMGRLSPRELRVDRIVLMESRLTPTGALYSPLFEARLGDAA